MEITDVDKHNLFDLFQICIDNENLKDLHLNRLDRWFRGFRDKLELYCVPELNDAVHAVGEQDG